MDILVLNWDDHWRNTLLRPQTTQEEAAERASLQGTKPQADTVGLGGLGTDSCSDSE